MSSASTSFFPAQPEQILKGLGKLWTSLGEEEKHQGKPTVLRACAMTLIVATDEADGGFLASQTISELMREHPSRGIVLAVSDEAERPGGARSWRSAGSRSARRSRSAASRLRSQRVRKAGRTLGLL